jgi:hypothetical protein
MTPMLRKFIINAQPTGSDAFDELHRNLAPMLTKYRNSSPTDLQNILHRQKALSALAKLWEINHPGYTFFPPKE